MLAIVTLPVKLPVAVGANLTLRFADWPTPIVSGKLVPVTLNVLPLTVALVTDRLDPPVFDTVTV